MTQQTQFNVTSTKLVKLLKKTIKGVMAEQGINPSTRKGNKELDILVKRIAKQPFESEEAAINVAKTVGKNLVDLSKKQDKAFLDKGVVRQLSLQNIPLTSSATSGTKETSQPKVSSQPVDKSPAKTSEPVKTEKVAPEAKAVKQEPTASPKADKDVTSVKEEPAKTDEKVTPETKEVKQEPTANIKSDEETSEVTTDLETDKKSSDETPKNSIVGLKERLTEDIKLAMKAKDKIRLETVRSLKKVVLEKEVEVRPKGQETLTPEQELEVLAQQAKQRRDSIEQYREGGRDDLADKEAQELAIIETYLPAQLSEEEIEEIIDNIITSVGATSPKDMGKVMGPAMKELKGKADGKKVQELVKAKLA